MTKWYCCFLHRKVWSYAVDEVSGNTTMSRGEFLVCGQNYEAMVTGFKTKEDAEVCLKKDPYGVGKQLLKRLGKEGLRKMREALS